MARRPSVDEVRPARCPACDAASRPFAGCIVLHGHGLRSRQALGPPHPGAPSAALVFDARRYRCTACRAVTTVAPAETLSGRLYTAGAIVWALALFGLEMLSPATVRSLVSPWSSQGPTSAAGWLTLSRWARSAAEGELFACVRPSPADWSARQLAARCATTVAAYAPSLPEPPPLTTLAFLGAAHAR